MLRQPPSRSHRSRKLGPGHSFQAVLFIAVGIWIVYQLTHYSYGKRRAVAVETDGHDREPARRRLGRRGFVGLAAGHAAADGIADPADDPLSSGDGGEGDEDQEADEDGGGDDDVADADDSLAADEEDDDRDFQARDSSGEDKAKAHDGFSFRAVNGTDTARDGVAVLLLNATETDGAADGTAPNLSGSAARRNTSSVHLSSLHARGTAGVVANSFAVGAPGAENEKSTNKVVSGGQAQNNQFNKNGNEGSVAGHGISS